MRKSRKQLPILVMVLLCISWLCIACGSASGGATSSAEKTYDIRFVLSTALDDPTVPPWQTFAKQIEAQSHGHLKVQFFALGELGSLQNGVDEVNEGSAQMGIANIDYLTTFDNDLSALEAPFLFSGVQQYHQIFSSGFGNQVADVFAKRSNLQIIGWPSYGFSGIITTSRAIRNLSDFKGLKIRSTPGEAYTLTLKALGAEPIAIDANEVYTALETGTVDGAVTAASVVQESKLYEVAHYFLLHHYIPGVAAVYLNKGFYKSLPQNLREIIQVAANKAVRTNIAELGIDQTATIKTLEREGVTITNLSPAQQAQGRIDVRSVYATMMTGFGPNGKRWLTELQKDAGDS